MAHKEAKWLGGACNLFNLCVSQVSSKLPEESLFANTSSHRVPKKADLQTELRGIQVAYGFHWHLMPVIQEPLCVTLITIKLELEIAVVYVGGFVPRVEQHDAST